MNSSYHILEAEILLKVALNTNQSISHILETCEVYYIEIILN